MDQNLGESRPKFMPIVMFDGPAHHHRFYELRARADYRNNLDWFRLRAAHSDIYQN